MAAAQIVLTRTGPLAPWRGGGFGLFSTVDKSENRILLGWLETPEGDLPINVDSRTDEGREVIAFPTAARLDRLARRLAAEHEPADGKALRLEVWKRTFDASAPSTRRALVARVTVPLAP